MLERAAVEGCAGLIAVSEEMRDELAARYTLPAHALLFANYALSRDIAQSVAPGRGEDGRLRVVYQGSLSANGSHYDLRDHFRAIADAGLLLDVYPNRDAPAYRELARTVPGMRLMGSLAPADLMRALPAYDVGWAAFNPLLNAAHMDTALPNKAFEYLASGLPVAAGPHRRAAAPGARARAWAWSIDRPGELGPAWRRSGLARLRERVRDRRRRFTVEGHIGVAGRPLRRGGCRGGSRLNGDPARRAAGRGALDSAGWTTSSISASSPSTSCSCRASGCRSTCSSRATGSSTPTACWRTGPS